MQDIKVKERMVPLNDYATVKEDATLYDAVLALESAQKGIEPGREKHAAVLVCDNNGKVIGKLTRWSILRGIEPQYKHIGDLKETSRFGFSPDFIKSMLTNYGLFRTALQDLCKKAAEVNVKDLMQTLSDMEYIDENATIDQAIHQLVMGHLASLLVTRGGDIIGILRLSDVFNEVCAQVKACKL
ncbi:CBS domain-containing protein [uncultured Desulfobacterium sp.]|uniref:CBS domain-containing protein n=1 Tax=uncultured Desulfobacterium sp. TaxID=201089 RepID=A0A445N2A6_9BACT|nr:CBS domain-containing protein [uncultured Desulfobacterium sp.]